VPRLNYQTKEEAKAAQINVMFNTQFAEKWFTTDDGSEFSLEERAYLWPLYDYEWPTLVIMSSRQAEKSTYVAKDSQTKMFRNENESILYATAHSKHLITFSRQKINKQFEYKPELKQMYLGPGTINNIHEKRYANGSVMWLRAIGQDAESARSISARGVYFDEVQSILSDSIAVTMEVTQAYENSFYAFTGTPLTPQNVLSVRYNNSTQMEWIVTCHHCNKKNPPLGKDHIDEKKPYLFCLHCGKKMSALNGKWIQQNLNGAYPGYRICRLMTPNCRWRTEAKDGVLDKIDGPDAYPEHRFVNEVLGLPEGIGIQPITQEVLYANCADTDEFDWIDPQRPPAWLFGVPRVASIDWAWSTKEGGQSYTIYALWTMWQGRMRCLYAKRQVGRKYADPEFSLNDMVGVFSRCNIQLIGTDYGIGHKENIRLRNKLGDNHAVFEFMYAGTYGFPVYRAPERRYHIGRTESLDDVYSDLNRGKYLFPRIELAKQYIDDIMNVYTEFDENSRRKKYEHAGTGPDDFLHLCNYARLTFLKL
jgi:hypothetical protein